MKFKRGFIVAMFILLGSVGRGYAQPFTFDDFVIALGGNNTTINLEDYLDPLNFTHSISDLYISGNFLTIKGLVDGTGHPNPVAVLDGAGAYFGFEVRDKQFSFQEKMQFQNFRENSGLGGVFLLEHSTFSFGVGFFNFIDSYASQKGGAISALNSNIDFVGNAQGMSTVTFRGNSALGYGGGMSVENSSISMTLAIVDFDSNSSNVDSGGGLYSKSSRINFDNSDVRFLKNYAVVDGGAIYSEGNPGFNFSHSTFNFSHSTVNFSTNTARERGGAIYAKNSNFDFTNGKVSFFGNQALGLAGGGAIYAHHQARFSFRNSDIEFTSNAAVGGGGAIYLDTDSQEMIFEGGKVIFTSNSANEGGGVYVHSNSKLNFNDITARFFGHQAISSGGAIAARASTVKFENSDVLFDQNSANGIPNDVFLDGTSLYLTDSKTTMLGGIIAHSNNSIYQQRGVWTLSGLNEFQQMSAFSVQSGKMKVERSTFTYFDISAPFTLNHSTVVFEVSSVSFLGNAKDISLNFSQFIVGGSRMQILDGLDAVSSDFQIGESAIGDPSFLLFSKRNLFERTVRFFLRYSSASFVKSEALYQNGYGIGVIGSTITFNYSSAAFIGNVDGDYYAGAMEIYHSWAYFEYSTVTFIDNRNWNSNGGGAINARPGELLFSNSNIKFTSNTAAGNGGAIQSSDFSNINFLDVKVSFTSNSALSNTAGGGGAIYIERSALGFTGGAAAFIDNKSAYNGGAMFIEDAEVSFTSVDVKFHGNRAANFGGAIYLNKSKMEFNFNDVSFVNNSAAEGGAIYINASEVSFRNAPNSWMFVDFSNNTSADIEFLGSVSALLFTVDGGTMSLRDGLRTQGQEASNIIKEGVGKMIFSGQDSRLMNTFHIN